MHVLLLFWSDIQFIQYWPFLYPLHSSENNPQARSSSHEHSADGTDGPVQDHSLGGGELPGKALWVHAGVPEHHGEGLQQDPLHQGWEWTVSQHFSSFTSSWSLAVFFFSFGLSIYLWVVHFPSIMKITHFHLVWPVWNTMSKFAHFCCSLKIRLTLQCLYRFKFMIRTDLSKSGKNMHLNVNSIP